MLSQVFGLLGCPGPPKPYVFTGVRAPRGPWGSKALCFDRVSGSWGGLGAPVFSHVFVLPLRCPGISKTLCFHRFFWLLGCSGCSKTQFFHRFSGSSGDLGTPAPCVFAGFLAPQGSLGAPKPYGLTDVLAPWGPWEFQNPKV